MKIGRLAVGLFLALGVVAIAQQVLTNESIEMMARARLGDDVTVSLIQNLGPLVAVLCLALSAAAVVREALTNESNKKMARVRSGARVTASSTQNRGGQYDGTRNNLVD
jgi:hypothetical protein